MKATLLFRERIGVTEATFVELVAWHVPSPVRGSAHHFKYRIALVSDGECVLRYDNEAGKGDHRHWGGKEAPYAFRDLKTLQADFWKDVAAWLEKSRIS